MYSVDEATRELAPAPTGLARLRHRFDRKRRTYNRGAKVFVKVVQFQPLAVAVTHYLTCNSDYSALSKASPFCHAAAGIFSLNTFA